MVKFPFPILIAAAVVKSVEVILKRKDGAVYRICSVVNSVAEVHGAVVHRDRHLFNKIEFAVVITDIFHFCQLPKIML